MLQIILLSFAPVFEYSGGESLLTAHMLNMHMDKVTSYKSNGKKLEEAAKNADLNITAHAAERKVTYL